MSASRALAWELWARQRWAFVTGGAYLAILSVIARALPAELRSAEGMASMGALLIPLLCLTPWFLASLTFCFNERFEAAGSTFPGRLFTLPVSTLVLVTCPMLIAAAGVVLVWCACVWGVLWPSGADVPLLWPGLLLAALVAWLQALSWAPFGVPYLRLVVAGLVIPGLPATAGALVWELGAPEGALVAVLVVAMLLAYGVALIGVGRARCGEGSGLAWPAWLTWSRPAQTSLPFSSPFRAMLWLEWRRFGYVMMIAGPICAAVALGCLWGIRRGVELYAFSELSPGLTELVATVGSGWVTVAQLLFVPLLFAIASSDLGRLDVTGRNYALSSFIAVRPVTTAELVGSKLCATALSMLFVWALVLLTALSWAVLSGNALDMAERLSALGGARAWLALGLVLAALVVLTWARAAAGLWVGLSGRTWVAGTMIVLGFVGLTALAIAASWALRHSEHHGALGTALPWVVGVALGLKLPAAGWVLRLNVQRGLVATRVVGWTVAVWLVAVVGLFALLAWLVPSEWACPALLAGLSLLAVPLAGIGLAPLALEWNRHR